jgi:hypothetical protein
MQITNPKTSAFLAALPHLNIQNQKQLAMMVKMMEMRDVIKYYDNHNTQAQTSQPNPKWRQDLIKAVMPHISQKNKINLENMLQIMEMQDMVTVMKNI